MNSTFCLAALIVAVPCLLLGDQKSLVDAYRNGAMSRVVYRIVDERGEAVSNATAYISYRSCGRPQDDADLTVLSDCVGRIVAEHRTNEKVTTIVSKEGYYDARDEISYFDAKRNDASNGRWLPYGETRTLVLKPVLSPVALVSSDGLDYYKYPAWGSWTGFDLLKRDWVQPFGKGENQDMLIRFTRQDSENGYRKTMEVSFTNNPYAGVYQMTVDRLSEMDSVYRADTNENYQSSLNFMVERDSKGIRRHDLEEGRYLVFRTRTTTNEVGVLTTAHYGKIYGNWRFGERGGMAIRKIEFNPTPNDANLEPKRKVAPRP